MPRDVVIIVPAYHSALTLERCLESLKKQTYGQLEIVVVDDGNEDDSIKAITQSFILQDERFRYLRQENQGPGAARNYALSQISGLNQKWVSFVDSDDYVELDYIERLLKKALESGCMFVSTGGGSIQKTVSGEDALCDLASWKLSMGVSNRIIHGSLLLHSPFGTWSRYGEDTVATFRELAQLVNDKIALYPDSFGYHYVNNPSSSTHDPLIPSKAVEYVFLWAKIYEEAIAQNLSSKVTRAVLHRFDSEYLQMKGFIECNWRELTDEAQAKYLFSTQIIDNDRLIKKYRPKTIGERLRRRLCMWAPHIYVRLFKHP